MYAVISRSEPDIPAPLPEPPLQRARGVAALSFNDLDGNTVLSRMFHQGSAKWRFPRKRTGEPPEAVLLNIAGGMAGGDSQDVSVRLAPQACATITTQACERIYRSLGADAKMAAHIELEAGARLAWLPQPLILFDGGRLLRETRISLAASAALLAVESVIFGRISSGESVQTGALSDGWIVNRDARLILKDRFHLDGAIGTKLVSPAVLGENRAMAVIRYIAPDAAQRLNEMRALLSESQICAACSAWNGMLIARFLAREGYSLIRELARVISAFRGSPMPRAWMI